MSQVELELVNVARGAIRRLTELGEDRAKLIARFQRDLSAERHCIAAAAKRVDADLEMLRLNEMGAQVIRNELVRGLVESIAREAAEP